MGESLSKIVEDELSQPAPPDALALAREIRRRHGEAVDAVLFYGSCLRKKQTRGGVLDFYVIVDSYNHAYESRMLAWTNALLPPNIFFVELDDGGEDKLRAKYAVISRADFREATRPSSLHSIVWSRFSQPSVLAWVRDERVRRFVADAATEAVLTMIGRMVALVDEGDGEATRIRPERLWQLAFAETYRSEFRTESPETIRAIYEAAPGRYDRVAHRALEELARRGKVEIRRHEGHDGGDEGRVLDYALPVRDRKRLRVDWNARRRLAKGLYAVRLVKSAVTIGDWVPYALWKLRRQTGVTVELTDRQRRHPMIYGWPVVAKLLRRRDLR
jgi:predicted nucleotidyltransferase